jgi:hypothetical protein
MSTKTKTYHATTANPGISNNSLLCSLSDCTVNSRPLSKEESKTLKAISSTENESFYNGIIRQRFQEIEQGSDAILYTELIDTLVSQLNDCEATMLKIIGENGVSALRKVSTYSKQ